MIPGTDIAALNYIRWGKQTMNDPRMQSRGLAGLSGAIATGALAAGAILMMPSQAMAQAAYGSYVGAGISVGLTEGDELANEDQTTSGVIAFRYQLMEIPVSLRAQLLTFTDTSAIVPTISYDVPLSWQADAYIGAGVAFQDGGADNDTSPIGNDTALVIQPGVDYMFPYSNMVLFGNAIIAFDAYEIDGGTAASLQGGVGLRF